MDKFFITISKYIIYVPIAIVVLALIFKFNQTSKTLGELAYKLTPTPTTTSQRAGFDLKGPYQCQYKDKDGKTYKVYIKNKKVLFDKYFFDGDCLFIDNIKKMCNLSPYVSIIEGALNNNLSMINTVAANYLKADVDVGKILETCVKKDFDETIFE